MDILFSSFKTMPAYLALEAQAQIAKQAYDIAIAGLKLQLKAAEDEFKAKRDVARANANFEYSVTVVANEHGRHYCIKREIIEPLIGDDKFNEPINYGSFRIVNNVFISTGSGYMFQRVKNGDVMDMDIVATLDEGIVPEIFKNKPVMTLDNMYNSGT